MIMAVELRVSSPSIRTAGKLRKRIQTLLATSLLGVSTIILYESSDVWLGGVGRAWFTQIHWTVATFALAFPLIVPWFLLLAVVGDANRSRRLLKMGSVVPARWVPEEGWVSDQIYGYEYQGEHYTVRDIYAGGKQDANLVPVAVVDPGKPCRAIILRVPREALEANQGSGSTLRGIAVVVSAIVSGALKVFRRKRPT